MRPLLALLFLFLAPPAIAEAPERVITIGGALTEIVYALKAEGSLVGSDTTSYYPPEARDLPKVGYQRTISAEGVLSLNPDMVILTDEAGPPAVLKQLKSAGVRMLKLKSGRSLGDVKDSIWEIAAVLDRREDGRKLIKSINRQSEELKKSSVGRDRKRIMFILNHGGGTLAAGGETAADAIISLSGAVNAVKGYKGYKPLTPEAAVAFEPDVILLTRRGLERAGGVDGLLKLPGLALTPAGRNRRVAAMDSLLLLGFGPRTVSAAAELVRICGEL